MKQFSRHRQLLFCAAHFFGIFSSPPTHTVETTYIHAHSAKPILNQNNQTNLTRYVSLSRVSSYPIRLPTATLYQKKPTRVLHFWKTLEVVSSRSPITSLSFCRINLLSSTILFRAKLRQVRQVWVFSRSVCSRGLRERGGCGEEREYNGKKETLTLFYFTFRFVICVWLDIFFSSLS